MVVQCWSCARQSARQCFRSSVSVRKATPTLSSATPSPSGTTALSAAASSPMFKVSATSSFDVSNLMTGDPGALALLSPASGTKAAPNLHRHESQQMRMSNLQSMPHAEGGIALRDQRRNIIRAAASIHVHDLALAHSLPVKAGHRHLQGNGSNIAASEPLGMRRVVEAAVKGVHERQRWQNLGALLHEHAEGLREPQLLDKLLVFLAHRQHKAVGVKPILLAAG